MSNTSAKGSTITITDVLWRMLASWKLVIILAIIGFLIASIYVKKTYAQKEAKYLPAQTEYDRVMNDYKTELDRVTAFNLATQDERKNMAVDLSAAWTNKLTQEQLSVVENALSIKRLINANTQYKEKSVLMKIDPYNVHTLYLVYELSSETGSLTNILNDYVGYVTSEECIKAVAEKLGWETSEDMISSYTELFVPAVINGSQFAVTVSYSDDKIYDIARVLETAIESYRIKAAKNIGDHTLKRIEEQIKVVVNTNIANTQNTYHSQQVTYSNQLTGQLNAMKAVPEQYNLYSLKSQEADGSEEFLDLMIPTEPKLDAPKRLRSANTYKIIGMLLGVLIALISIYMYMLFSTKLQKTKELNGIYGLAVVGFIYKKRAIIIDSLITRIHMGSKGPKNNESAIKLLQDRIVIICEKRDIKNLGIIGTSISRNDIATIESLIKGLKSEGIEAFLVGDILNDEGSARNIGKTENCIIIETVNKSKYKHIDNELLMLENMKIEPLCAIGIE